MALTVGTDTYLEAADADSYIEENYLSTDANRTAWSALSVADKEVCLRRAAKIIDRQPFVGVKADPEQEMEFPRAILSKNITRGLPVSYAVFGSEWVVMIEVPVEIGYAQAEIALTIAVGPSERLKLQQQGVSSFSLGKLSESYTGANKAVRLYSPAAYEYLLPYLAGSVPVG